MKKKIIYRSILGFPLGIAFGLIIALIISIFINDGTFYLVNPVLIETYKNELNSAILQTLLTGAIGSGFAAVSVIWEIESWSLVKQSGIYFGMICLILLPVSYLLHWMEHSLIGFISYFLIFISIFIIVWLIQYLIWKHKIKKINNLIKNNDSSKI